MNRRVAAQIVPVGPQFVPTSIVPLPPIVQVSVPDEQNEDFVLLVELEAPATPLAGEPVETLARDAKVTVYRVRREGEHSLPASGPANFELPPTLMLEKVPAPPFSERPDTSVPTNKRRKPGHGKFNAAQFVHGDLLVLVATVRDTGQAGAERPLAHALTGMKIRKQ